MNEDKKLWMLINKICSPDWGYNRIDEYRQTGAKTLKETNQLESKCDCTQPYSIPVSKIVLCVYQVLRKKKDCLLQK